MAPVVKGILISLSILTAIGIAVYENPQVKEWVEDQRRKIAEFLRSFGDELDPQSRREAEAFAYEGRMPTHEAAGALNAVARATGREIVSDNAVDRRNRQSSLAQSPDEVDERKRLGREYLAKRNQEMLELREKQKMRKSMSSSLSEKTPPSPTFDQLVNDDGTLKLDGKAPAQGDEEEMNEKSLELPSVPTEEPKSWPRQILIEETPEAAYLTGSRYANPFGDEFELSGTLDSRSPTPKPPVPPKIALEDSRNVRKLPVTQKEPSIRQIPIMDQDDEAVPENLSFEEQLARALSISLAESEAAARLQRQKQEQEQEAAFSAAIAASLAEAETYRPKQTEELVSFTPDPPMSISIPNPASVVPNPWTDNDELYTLSPNLRHSNPASIPAPLAIPANDNLETNETALTPPIVCPNCKRLSIECSGLRCPTPTHDIIDPCSTHQYDPVHEAAANPPPSQPSLPQTPTTATLSPDFEREAISLPSYTSSLSGHSDDFESVGSRNGTLSSPAGEEGSLIEFADVESLDGDESSDEEGDGVLTPGSWTDVGSDVGSDDVGRMHEA